MKRNEKKRAITGMNNGEQPEMRQSQWPRTLNSYFHDTARGPEAKGKADGVRHKNKGSKLNLQRGGRHMQSDLNTTDCWFLWSGFLSWPSCTACGILSTCPNQGLALLPLYLQCSLSTTREVPKSFRISGQL